MVRASGSARLFAPKNTASVTAETHMAIVLYPSTAYLLPVYNAFIIIFSILFIENSAVTAYLSAIPFFEKNGFKMLLGNDENKHTRTMYFDMLEL